MLLLGSEEEVLQELRCCEVTTATHVDILGNVLYDIDHFLLLIELQSFLREIAEAYGVADVEASAVGRHQTKEHANESGLAGAVVAHDAHFLETGEIIIKVFQNDTVVESLRHVLALKDLRTDIDIARLQTDLSFLDTLLGDTFQLVEGLLTITGLMTTGLWHATHPLQFGAVEVVGSGNLSPTVIDSLLSFLEIITVIAAIGVDGLVVEFEDDGAYTIEEETVVGDHE